MIVCSKLVGTLCIIRNFQYNASLQARFGTSKRRNNKNKRLFVDSVLLLSLEQNLVAVRHLLILTADVPPPPEAGVSPARLPAHVIEVPQLADNVSRILGEKQITIIPRGNSWLGNEVTFMLSATSLQILSPSLPLAPAVGDHTELHFFPATPRLTQ